MLQDLLTVSFEQQGGHTQAVGVEPFELVIKNADSFFMKNPHIQMVLSTCIYYYFFSPS